MSASEAPAMPAEVKPPINQGAGAVHQAHTIQPDNFQVRDLKAQEDMAFWAMLTFYVGLASAILALFAVIGVVVDIILARKRNRIDQRPWLTFKAELVGPVHLAHDEESGNRSLKFRFNVTIKNVGSTPAGKAFLKGKMFNILRGGDAPEEFIREHCEGVKNSVETGFVLGPNEEITKFYQMSLLGDEFGVHPNPHSNGTYPMAVFSICYSATNDRKLVAQTAKGILLHCADWIGGGFQFGSAEIEEIQSGEANNIGTAT
jgi:hypothetical protein